METKQLLPKMLYLNMKLRLEKNSLTLRLSPDEKVQLSKELSLQESLSINSDNCFAYALIISEDVLTMSVSFQPLPLTVLIPKEQASRWFQSGQVGIHSKLTNSHGEEILVVVEEDLPPRKRSTTL